MSIKYCPKCGYKLEEGAKRCPKCGTQINISSQSNTNLKKGQSRVFTDEDTKKSKELLIRYFNWFLSSIKSPSKSINTKNKSFGLISFIISAVISVLMSITFFDKLLDLSNSSNGQHYNGATYIIKIAVDGLVGFSSKSAFSSVINTIARKIDLLVILMILAFIMVGFVGKILISKNSKQKVNFFEYLNQLAAFTNISNIILLLALLGLFVQGFNALKLVFILLVITKINSLTGLTYSIISDNQNGKIDKLHVAVLAIIVYYLVLYVISKVLL
ncbi:hypothetical protein AKUG0406_06960 [Apilactobacillus kunkeei]|nr:hypothetical protein AKUG0406_06960 [Apilactobacillus kunkeei]CAI2595852.1 hypothetical protein AKUG0403_06960 [Apilactobacillus kunkeei]CAI2596494.1 hypothetical protein AKUG0420_07030 [Apilactobacillus kunkeei]